MKNWIGHLQDGVILLLRPESFSFLHKKAKSWRILVFVVEWRHRAIKWKDTNSSPKIGSQSMNCDLIAVFASDLRTCERTQRYFTLIHIGHLHISRNAPCLPPKILYKHCLLFLLGLQQYPREIEDNVYAKFWGANKVYYGRCANGNVFMFFRNRARLPAASGLYKAQVVRWCDVQSLVHVYKIIRFTKKFEDISKCPA